MSNSLTKKVCKISFIFVEKKEEKIQEIIMEKEKQNKTWLSFVTTSLVTILIIVTITTKPWGVLTIKSGDSDVEIGNFGIWNSCKKSQNDSSEVCKSAADGNFTVYAFDKNQGSKVDIDYGNKVYQMCTEDRNVTISNNGTNTTELKQFFICRMERVYERVELERIRVFAILAAVVSFCVAVAIAVGNLQNQLNQFIPAILSLLVPLWMMICLAVFTGLYGAENHFILASFEYGWSFILGWISAFLSLFNTLYLLYSAFTTAE